MIDTSLHGRVLAVSLSAVAALPVAAQAATTVFFDAAQTGSITHGATSDTLASEGYLFTYSLDNLFTGGVGLTTPIGRNQAVHWPAGLSAQAITTGPVGSAAITISRADQQPFDLDALTFKLEGNTWATGAEIEIAPTLLGNDGPHVFLDATGVGGHSVFSYSDTVADWRGFTTAPLKAYDSYSLSLFVDFDLLGITLSSNAAPVPLPPGFVMMLGAGLLGVFRRKSRGLGAVH